MAGLFGDLFQEDSVSNGLAEVGSACPRRKLGIDPPPRPRLKCNLAGIENQGATCYLNSLLQTLLLTPEFRDGLFCLDEQELGNLFDAEKPGSKVRVIPIQLQRLFARLLLKNCQSVSTTELTESFGWTDNEHFQQHDVQELNRILFSAIESSLVGTSGKHFITKLYHGQIVNQIRCTVCQKVSEREEDFLDIPVTVAGSSSLEQSLQASYIDVEMLDGKNQYRCGACNKLVDAAKGAKLRNLPSILTISLLRFSFDYQKLERYKETGKFSFPHNINMTPYCQKVGDGEDLDYELFSVIIHSGGAHGGHYHAYIRDIDALGHWVTPEDEEIVIPTDPLTGTVDFIECDTPIELVQFILAKTENQTMLVEKLGQEILKQTGTSWNKRFKSKYGPITKFVSKHDDKFIYDSASKSVMLKQYNTGNNGSTNNGTTCIQNGLDSYVIVDSPSDNKMEDNSPSPASHDQSHDQQAKNNSNYGDGRKCSNKNKLPEMGYSWFDFNDSRVHPIYSKSLEKQFSGKESAYMLVYRKKSLTRPPTAQKNRLYCMSDALVTEVSTENEILNHQREQYDLEVNKLVLQVHFGAQYQYREGALKPCPGPSPWQSLEIDQRNTATDLYTAVREKFGDPFGCGYFQINKFKELVAGGHLYDVVPETTELSLQHLDIFDGSSLFVWNGETVQDQIVPTGADTEPIYVNVIYGDGLQFAQGYAKGLTIQEVMVVLCDIIRINLEDIKLKRIFGKDADVRVVTLTSKEEMLTLAELGIQDGDQLLAQDRSLNGETLSHDSIASTVYSSKLVVQVENKCVETDIDTLAYPTLKLEVDKNVTVGELKAIAMAKLGLVSVQDGGRLRIDHETLGLRHPIHEELSVFEAGIIQGCCLVLEPGPSPRQNEITLCFTSDASMTGPDYSEVMVPRNTTVDRCLQCILERANITEGEWHLRKTNWCGEAAELLDDPDQSLDACMVNDGDVLLLEEGRLPPKGYVRLPIWLYSTPESMRTGSKQEGGIMCWMTGLYNLFYTPGTSASSSTNPESSRTSEVLPSTAPLFLGEVEISREATLADLKQQVMTLSMVAELPVPSEAFIRLRTIENKRLATVLREKNQTLKRLKLTSNSVLALQILPEEEELSPHQLVLSVCMRVPDTHKYGPDLELVWDTSQGATIHSLKQAITQMLYIETEHLCLAKHFPQRYEWMVLEKQDKNVNQKGKKKTAVKNNIRQAPFHVRDGDSIGVKDMRYDPNNIDNFMTDEDEKGQIQIKQEIEEKRKMREERKKMFAGFDVPSKSKRPELGIKIKVGDFS